MQRMKPRRTGHIICVSSAAGKIAGILATCDRMMFAPKLGLRLLHPPIANSALAVRLAEAEGEDEADGTEVAN